MAATTYHAKLEAWIRRGAGVDHVGALLRAAYERHQPATMNQTVSDDIAAETPSRRLPESSRTVAVHDGSTTCQRSENGATRVDALGYRDVRTCFGGRQDWEGAGLPIEPAPPRGTGR